MSPGVDNGLRIILDQHAMRLDRLEKDFSTMSLSMTEIKVLLANVNAELHNHKLLAEEVVRRVIAEHENRAMLQMSKIGEEHHRQWSRVYWSMITLLFSILGTVGYELFHMMVP